MKKAIVLSALVSIGCGAYAQEQIPIVDASFEDPVTTTYTSGGLPGWVQSGPGNVGVVSPGAWDGGVNPAAPDGTQFGYINGWGNLTTISQTLNATVAPDSSYTLSIEVGGWVNGAYNPGTDYSVSLYAGDTLLASVPSVAPTAGSWTTLEATYVSGDSVPTGDLEVVIATKETQLDFDNVTLTDPPVPDSGSTSLICGMGLAALAWLRRKLA
jgi:hypothetical protein